MKKKEEKPETSEEPLPVKKLYKKKLSLPERMAPFTKKPSVNPEVVGLTIDNLLNELKIGTTCEKFNLNFENYYQLARKNPVPKNNPKLKNIFQFDSSKQTPQS